jgi:hypothetical protein
VPGVANRYNWYHGIQAILMIVRGIFCCGILQMSRVGLEWHGASDVDFLIHTSGWGCPTIKEPKNVSPIRPMVYAYLYIVSVLQHLELHKFMCHNSNTMGGILQCDEIGYYVTSRVGRGLCSNMLQKVMTHVISF